MQNSESRRIHGHASGPRGGGKVGGTFSAPAAPLIALWSATHRLGRASEFGARYSTCIHNCMGFWIILIFSQKATLGGGFSYFSRCLSKSSCYVTHQKAEDHIISDHTCANCNSLVTTYLYWRPLYMARIMQLCILDPTGLIEI
jgi:hypothetical protein